MNPKILALAEQSMKFAKLWKPLGVEE